MNANQQELFNEKDYQTVLSVIGYTPENDAAFLPLLTQAFTRSSYAVEHGGEDNETLEFIGDSALRLALVECLTAYYGANTSGGTFAVQASVGTLTSVKSSLEDTAMLSERVSKMGLQRYLIMNSGDTKERVDEQDGVKEDLFEAIVGAVALDCGFDMQRVVPVVKRMLDFDNTVVNASERKLSGKSKKGEFDNPKGQLQEWLQPTYPLPIYELLGDTIDKATNTHTFTVRCTAAGATAVGKGTSKPKAEAQAAAAVLAILLGIRN